MPTTLPGTSGSHRPQRPFPRARWFPSFPTLPIDTYFSCFFICVFPRKSVLLPCQKELGLKFFAYEKDFGSSFVWSRGHSVQDGFSPAAQSKHPSRRPYWGHALHEHPTVGRRRDLRPCDDSHADRGGSCVKRLFKEATQEMVRQGKAVVFPPNVLPSAIKS